VVERAAKFSIMGNRRSFHKTMKGKREGKALLGPEVAWTDVDLVMTYRLQLSAMVLKQTETSYPGLPFQDST